MSAAPDATVAASLMRGVSAADPALAAHRERQVALWAQTHDPSRLAAEDFEHCQRSTRLGASLGSVGVKCFSLAMIPATAEGYKAAARTREQATEQMVQAYGSQVRPDYLRRVVDDVYAKVAQATQYEVHRQVLAACVRDLQ
jgi:hypothetical protein